MGRPLNKKFFGNLNFPYNNVPYNLTGTGGQSLASFTITGAGSYTTIPTVTISTPDLDVEGNTTATAHVVSMKAVGQAQTTANGTGYVPGDILSVTAGTYSTTATYTVQAVTAVSAIVGNPGTGYAVGDLVYLSMGGQTTATDVVLQITEINTSTGAAISVGIHRGGAYTSIPSGNGGNNYNVAYQSGTGNGSGTRNFTVQWGVYSFNTTPTVAGVYTALGTNPVALSGGSGSGARANITYGINAMAVDNTGSGYINAPTVSFAPTGGSTVSAVLTNNASGNGILNVTAWVPYISTGTANTSGSAIAGDIVKQEGSRRYYVDTNQGFGVCKLITTATNHLTIGQMNLIATDANGSTYYVAKLTAHRATLVQATMGSSFLFDTDQAAEWTVGAATGTIVSIASI